MLDENVTNLIFIVLQFISFLRDIVSKVSAILFQEIKRMIELLTLQVFWFRNVTEQSFQIFLRSSQSDNGILTFFMGNLIKPFDHVFNRLSIVEKNDTLKSIQYYRSCLYFSSLRLLANSRPI